MAIKRFETPQMTGRATNGYERTDASAKWIFGAVSFLVLAGIVIHFIIAGSLESFFKRPQPTDTWSKTEVTHRPAIVSAPFPRLQISPPLDLQAFRAREESELNSYGWVDKKAGIARVPIQTAMEMLLERGLPGQAATNQTNAGPSSYELIQQRSPEPAKQNPTAPK